MALLLEVMLHRHARGDAGEDWVALGDVLVAGATRVLGYFVGGDAGGDRLGLDVLDLVGLGIGRGGQDERRAENKAGDESLFVNHG